MERLSAQTMAVSLLVSNLQRPRDVLRFAVKQTPDKSAIISESWRLTFRDLSDRVFRLASGLNAIGIMAGSHIFAFVEDELTQIEIQLAAYELGAALTMFNPTHTPGQILEAKDIIDPDLFIWQPPKKHPVEFLPERFDGSLIVRLGEQNSYEYIIAGGDNAEIVYPVPEDSACLTTFMFDTDGFATPVVFTQQDVLSNLRLILSNISMFPSHPEKRFVSMLPFNTQGSSMLLPHLLMGSAIVISENRTIEQLPRIVDELKTTHLFLTPGHLIELLDDKKADKYDFASLKNIVIGVDQLPAAVFEEAALRFGNILQTSFGLTDMYSLVSILKVEDYLDRGNLAPRQQLRSAGRVVKPIRSRIVDRKGAPVMAGIIGELLLQTPSLSAVCLHSPASSGEFEYTNWIRTGEQGYFDEHGLLHIINPLSEVVHHKGHAIIPRMVEEILHTHPAIREACLVKNDHTNQLVMCVSLKRKADIKTSWDLLSAELKQYLSRWALPWQVPESFVKLERLPRNTLSRMDRPKAVAMMNSISSAARIN